MNHAWVRAFGSPRMCVAVLGAALVATMLVAAQGLQPCDDAYITFRHAKNLAVAWTPAWNLTGDPVLGSTTPALVFALGAIGLVVGAGAIEGAALAINALAMGVIVVFTYLVVLDLVERPLPALLAALLVGGNGVNVFVFSLGFENAALVATLLVALFAARRRAFGTALVLASVAPLIRPEGLLLTPLVWALVLLGRGFRPRLLAAFCVVPLAWAGFSTSYYGSPVPQPIHAKKRFPAIHRPYTAKDVDLGARAAALPSSVASLWNGKAKRVLFTGRYDGRPSLLQRLAEWVALLGLPCLLAWLVRRRDGRVAYVLYAPSFLVLYAWIGRTEVWYFPSFVTFATITLFAGCALTAYRFAGARPAGVVVAGVFALFATTNAWVLNRDAHADGHKSAAYPLDPRGPAWQRWERERFDGYRAAARFLASKQDRPDTALISEVGVFGYFYDGPVIDAVGLCSPEVLPFYPPPRDDIYNAKGGYRTPANNFVPTAMITTLAPRFVVNALIYVPTLAQRHPALADRYRVFGRAGTAWRSPIYVFERTEPAERVEL